MRNSTQILFDFIHQLETNFFVSHLPATKHQLNTNLVLLHKERFCARYFDVIIIGVNSNSEFNFFEPGCFFRLLFTQFFLIIFILTVINDLTNRWFCVRRNFNKIKPNTLGLSYGLLSIYDTKLFLSINDSNLWSSDTIIDPIFWSPFPKVFLFWSSDNCYLSMV